MDRSKTIPIGVIVARESFDNPWIDHAWTAHGVALDFPPDIRWKKLSANENSTHYIVSSTLGLFRGETAAYLANINDAEPSLYIVLRDFDESHEDVPLDVHLVTASPYEAQDYLDTGEDIVERIAMPQALIDEVKRFTAQHHHEEKFRKRKQNKVDVEEHKFGQEPIFVTRRRNQGSLADDDEKK